MRRQHLRKATVPILVTTLAAGCGHPTHHPPASTHTHTPTATPRPTDPTSSTKDAALAAYSGMWADMATAGVTADYQSPILTRHAVDNALTQLVHGLYLAHHDGYVIKGQPVTHPQVTSMNPAVDPTTVTVLDCMDSTHWLNYRLDGQLQDDQPGGRHKVTATVGKQSDGTWKVTDFASLGAGTC